MMNVINSNEGDVGRPLVGLLSGNEDFFIVSALETHKGPPYISNVNAMDSKF